MEKGAIELVEVPIIKTAFIFTLVLNLEFQLNKEKP